MRYLVSLLVLATASATSPRTLWTDSEAAAMNRGSVAADGRYACGVDDGRLIVRQLPSGAAVRRDRAGAFRVGRCLISPDSELIAYTTRGEGGVDEIHVIPRLSGQARLLFRDPSKPRLTLGQWGPDGKWLMIALIRSNGWSISELTITGSIRELHSVPFFDKASISPDGRWIVTCRNCDERTGTHCLFILARETGAERLLWQTVWDSSPHLFYTMPRRMEGGYAGVADLIAWSADGSSVFYVGDRGRSLDLWRLPVHDGRPAGHPHIVSRGMGVVGVLGNTSRNTLYYSPIVLRPYVLATVPVDAATGAIEGKPTILKTHSALHHEDPTWSLDNRKLIYYSSAGGTSGIWRLDTATGGETEIVPDLQGYNYFTWLPDESVIVWGVDRRGRTGFYRVYTTVRRTTFVAPLTADDQIGFPVATADGRTLFYRSDRRRGIVRLEMMTGREREIYRAPEHASIWSVRLSPDQRQIAFVLTSGETAYRRNWTSESIRVVPAEGGADHEVVHSDKNELQVTDHGVSWLPGSPYLLFLKRVEGRPPFGTFTLWRIAATGGPAEKVADAPERITWLEASPDGRKLVLTLRTDAPVEVDALDVRRN